MDDIGRFLSKEWLEEIRKLVNRWPDDTARNDRSKSDSYWQYFRRKRDGFAGVLAVGFRAVPGTFDAVFVGLTFIDGTCTQAEVLTSNDVRERARLALECKYDDWLRILNGYDIGKAMTYHRLPLVVGSASQLLSVVYFVHEVLVVLTRARAVYPSQLSTT